MSGTTQHGAAAPGLATPERATKSKAPDTVAAGRGWDQSKEASRDCACAHAERKAFETLRAQAALQGWQLHGGPAHYLLSCAHASHAMAELGDVQRFLATHTQGGEP